MSAVHTTSSQNDLGTEESQEDSDLRYAEVKLERETNFEEQESKQHLQEPVTELNLEESTIQTDLNETLGFQEWSDGSSYRGNVSMNLKLGSGQFKWVNGESYSGEFYNDHHHGKGIYTWPDGSKFLGSFYLSRREGFGTMMFNDNRKFQGLYKSDVRYGPGIETNNDGSQDVGIWLRNHLIKLCTSVRCSFSISSYPEFYQQSNETLCKNKDLHGQASEKGQREDPFLYSYKILLQEDSYTLPEKIYFYSSDIDHLPITPSARTEIDTHFYKDIDQPGHLGDLVSCEMQDTDEMKGIHLHVYKHRNSQEYLEWSIGSIMSAVRQKFGPRGSREQFAEKFIEMAGLGDYETVFMILRHDLAHVDVSDSCGHTALHSATVNSHDNIINLLLDNGADINKRNDEGISALSMCFILLYGTQSFRPNVAERNLNLCKGGSGDVALNSKEYLNDAFAKDDGPFNGLGEDMNRSITLSDHCHSDHQPNTKVPENVLCQTSTIYNSQEKLGTGSDRTPPVSEPKDTERRATLNLLLYRGADPNMCSIPMYALFFAVKAADITTVRLLLERGAHTDVRLATEHGALTPLHIAAAIPGIEGVKITELLLHAAADPNIRVENDDYIFEHDKVESSGSLLGFPMKGFQDSGLPLYQYYSKTTVVPEDLGRTPLHVACEREDNYKYARDIVSLLVSHNANLNVLWSGHSPLSLAVASGNDLAVKELLAKGAEPNLPLTRGVGSALCAAVDVTHENKRTLPARLALIDRLIRAGADILMPITIGEGKKKALGTATDYAYYKYFQDKRIAQTPYHALSAEERETFNARKKLLEHLGNLTREALVQKEKEWATEGIVRLPALRKTPQCSQGSSKKALVEPDASSPQQTFFKYCYACGRSVGVKLTPCSRCYCVFTCSKLCKKRVWNTLHKEECHQLAGNLSRNVSLNKEEKMKKNTADRLNRSKNLLAENEQLAGLPKSHASRNTLSITENYSFN